MKASAKFQAALRQSHTSWQYVDVIGPTNIVKRLHVTTGTVTVDRTAQFRRSALITCIDPDGTFMPKNQSSILTPFGTTVMPYRGIKYPDGSIEVYPLGVYNLSSIVATSTNPLNLAGTTIQIECYDRSRSMSRDKFLTAYSIDAGTLITDAIKILVRRTYPFTKFHCMTHHLTNPYPLTYAAGDDPWTAAQDLATAIGAQVYFDVWGDCVIDFPADIRSLGSPDWDYIEGQGCTMTDISAVYTDDPGYNGVIMTGATTGTDDPPVQGVSWDTDPSSPTYYMGAYGQVPEFVTNSNITTAVDAQTAAAALLGAQLGFATGLDITCWTNPALEIDDVIEVESPEVNATGRFVLDSFTVPMGGQNTGGAAETEQSLTVRQQRKIGT